MIAMTSDQIPFRDLTGKWLADPLSANGAGNSAELMVMRGRERPRFQKKRHTRPATVWEKHGFHPFCRCWAKKRNPYLTVRRFACQS